LDSGQVESDKGDGLRGQSITFGTDGGMIGRDTQQCSLVFDLPYVSREHARISHCGDDFFVEDCDSADGSYLNGLELDAGRKYSLRENDQLTIGDFVLQFKLANWFEKFLGAAKPTTSEPASNVQESVTADRPSEKQQSDQLAETIALSAPPRVDESQQHDLLRAFLDGAGLEPQIIALEDSNKFMAMIGRLLVTSIDGIRKALFTHDRFRDQYRIPGTVLSRSQMNPLYNQQSDTRHVMELLFTQSSRVIVDPVKAVEEATRDFYVHGLAVPTAVDQAIRVIFQSFDWQQLEQKFAAMMPNVYVGPIKKARLWQTYCEEFDRRSKTLDEFDNDYRRAVGIAYSEARARNQMREHERSERDA
jgi:predicted component of type VI protein secretion system